MAFSSPNHDEENKRLATLEALLFVAGEPTPLATIMSVLDVTEETALTTLAQLSAKYEECAKSGLELQEVAGGYRLCTKKEYGNLLKERYAEPMNLSSAALETLAIVAFKAPVTKAEIEALRGVGSDRSLATLVERGLVTEYGRAELPGRPILYDVTPLFRRRSGLTNSGADHELGNGKEGSDNEGTTAETD